MRASNDKAGHRLTHGSGSIKNHSTGKSKRIFVRNYIQFSTTVQCRHCASDYMRFSVNGYCQTCQQRAEFEIREHAERAKTKGGNQ
mgnify:CR=1 FL=1